MVENVIPRPFHYRPIELLPKGTGNRKPVRACLTQCRDRGRSLKIALQVPVGTQLFQEFAHNRITTVRSHPGSIWPTEMMSSVRCAPLASAARPNPSSVFDNVEPLEISSTPPYAVPSCRNCNC